MCNDAIVIAITNLRGTEEIIVLPQSGDDYGDIARD